MARILVADDERSICEAFSIMLRKDGHTPIVAASGEEALDKISAELPDAVFLDIQLPGGNGLDVLQHIHTEHPRLPVILMTAYGTLDTAMRARKLDAFDYLGKPVDLERVRSVLQRALHVPSEASPSTIRNDPKAVMVGRSAPMQEIFKKISLLTTNDLTVLISGESGAGKEVAARAIHSHSKRGGRPFVAVNCAAIPESLIESELFGHAKGAFTDAREQREGRFEAAGTGTLFLDEISELPYKLQSTLLRVLQERTFERVGSVVPVPFRARLIVASNRNLDEEVKAGRFRDDLFHRLDVFSLNIPPLRARMEDVEPLAMHLLGRVNIEIGRNIKGFEPAALERLLAHDWPGNVRELEHTIKRAVLITQGPFIAAHDLELSGSANGTDDRTQLRTAVRDALDARLADAGGTGGSVFRALVGEVEVRLIEEALRMTGGNQVTAARLLGISRTTLRKRLGN